MRPSPVPDGEAWENAERVVIGPPGGPEGAGIDPVECVVDYVQAHPSAPVWRRFNVRIVLEDGDLERLQAGEPFWVSLLASHLVPFQVSADKPVGALPEAVHAGSRKPDDVSVEPDVGPPTVPLPDVPAPVVREVCVTCGGRGKPQIIGGRAETTPPCSECDGRGFVYR